jgi:hypothetical protein
MARLRRAGGLREVAQFDIQIYLDLQFVDDRAASELETLNAANDNVIHFCNAVQSQVCIPSKSGKQGEKLIIYISNATFFPLQDHRLHC